MSEDRFVSPKPIFKPSTDPIAIEITTPKKKDHSPSPCVIQRLQDEGKTKLAALIAQIEAEAKKKPRRI